MRSLHAAVAVVALTGVIFSPAQEYGKADHESPGDEMFQQYLQTESRKLEASFLGDIKTKTDWERARPRMLSEYYHMLGLSPVPEKTPLNATITRTLDRGDYFVDMLHYQSRPGLYVTANLYRPARTAGRMPAVLYVCGHSSRGRDGNKTAFQSHGIWLARHGYICLLVDTLQLGEIAGIHHGTYREGRWWWLSRGYTPAGVECWNGIRGIDYLVSRSDVDAERIGVTGISGGGAATFWIAAADDRVKCAVPVSGMADIESYVANRVVNGHCDCMFLYNTYQWHWTKIAGLIAPRPLLFVNSDADSIFPMDANERIINRLERLYSLFGASDRVDSFVSVGGHDYRQDIRQGAFRTLNIYLKGEAAAVTDSETDLVTGSRADQHPIRPELLRVFPKDENLPKDALNGRIDESFVELARPGIPKTGEFNEWKGSLLKKLKEITFHYFPARIPAAVVAQEKGSAGAIWLRTEANIRVALQKAEGNPDAAKTLLLHVANDAPDAVASNDAASAIFTLEPRGIGATRWTTRNPPNYVERSHYLLGRTIDSGRVWDIIGVSRFLKEKYPGKRLLVEGSGRAGVLAVFSSLLEDDIDGVVLGKIPSSLMDASAPALLNSLRVADIPDFIGMLAPRPLVNSKQNAFEKSREIYRAAGAQDNFVQPGF